MEVPNYPPVVIDGCDTIPQLFWKSVQQRGNKVALREKKWGLWQPTPWSEYGEKAREIGMALIALGLERGDVCAILSENNKEWLFADMGILGVGGITNGVYTTDQPKQIAHLINDSASKFIFVENEEQLDKILEIRQETPCLEKIIIFDPDGLRDFQDDMVMTLDAFYEKGRAFLKTHDNLWAQEIAAAKPDDVMVLIYTSGTTGPPKGAMICHRNAMFQMELAQILAPSDKHDEQLSFLPLCHIAERLFSILWPLNSGATINFVEELDTIPENIREVSPTVFFGVPRIWEKFYSTIMIQMKDATRIEQWCFHRAFALGHRVSELQLENKPLPLGLKISHWIASQVVFKNLRRMMGMDRVHTAFTAAAPISPNLIKWYRALGVELYEIYGQTECTGIATANYAGMNKVSSIGVAVAQTKIVLSEQGEMWIQGPHVFLGYHNQPEKTAETLVDGWLHTGDVGIVDADGFYNITDRMKDIIITSGGKNISPSEIENQLKFSIYISDAVVIGDQRKYLSCLIMIDADTVFKFAQDHDVPFTNYTSLCHTEEIQALIGHEVEQVNQQLARVETIKKFRLIDHQLLPEDEELTPTMKLKRKFIHQKYKELIESMYA